MLFKSYSNNSSNVIDVGALGPYALETGAYSERVRVYSARVAGLGAAGAAAPRLLADLPHAERAALLAKPPLGAGDKDLVSWFLLFCKVRCYKYEMKPVEARIILEYIW